MSPAGIPSASGPPLVLIHGFLGSPKTWRSVLPRFERSRPCVLVELPGHGGRALVQEGPIRMEELTTSIVESLPAEGRFDLLGYSMGGRIALRLAVECPSRVRSLILESASPGIQDPSEREKRAAQDHRLAELIEMQGMDSFLKGWEMLPLFASQAGLPAPVRQAIRRDRSRTDVRAAVQYLRNFSPGSLPSMWGQLANLAVPLLFIAGQRDEAYRGVAREVGDTVDKSRVAVVSGAGHAVHLEQPEVFAALVLDFLAAISPEPSTVPGSSPWRA